MSQDLFPRKIRSFQTGEQSFFRYSGTGDASPYSLTQFWHVVWCKTGRVLADLRPDKFHGVQFWSTGGKVVDMQTWMSIQELLGLWTDMNFMAVPDKNDRPRCQPQDLFQENDRVLRTQVTQKGANTQIDPSQLWTHKQCAKQI